MGNDGTNNLSIQQAASFSAQFLADDAAYMKTIDNPTLEAQGGLMPTPAARKALKEGDTPFHFESGKSRLDQLPPKATVKLGEVFGYGAKKYGNWNWAEYAGEWSDQQLIGSTLRHLMAYQAGEDIDPESGLTHLAHAAANAMMLLELKINNKGTDDRNPLYRRCSDG